MQQSTPAKSAYIACSLIVLAALALSAVSQHSLTAENGLGWDGSQYARMTSQCWHETISAFEPFVYRIGAPCIAALLPGTPKTSLFTLNLGASVLFMFLLTAWLRRFVPDTVVGWLVAGMAMHWLGPLRYTWWYPTYIDPLALCAIVGGLLLRDRAVAFVLVCTAGAFVRETVLVVPAALAIGRCVTIAKGGAASFAPPALITSGHSVS